RPTRRARRGRCERIPRAVAALSGRARVGRDRTRLVPPLRRATFDPVRPPGRPPGRDRRTPRRDARGTTAHRRIPAPRSPHHGTDNLESVMSESHVDERRAYGTLRVWWG